MSDETAIELMAVMRELIAALNRSQINSMPMPPDTMPELTAHTAARWNEQMAQAAVDKTNAFLERQQDRHHLLLKQLSEMTRP